MTRISLRICKCLALTRLPDTLVHVSIIHPFAARARTHANPTCSYDGDEAPAQPAQPAPAAKAPASEPANPEPADEPVADIAYSGGDGDDRVKQEPAFDGGDMDMNGAGWNGNGGNQSYDNAQVDDDNYGPINVKEDG